jgi:hypothetical protein
MHQRVGVVAATIRDVPFRHIVDVLLNAPRNVARTARFEIIGDYSRDVFPRLADDSPTRHRYWQ